jgi:SPOR domain
VSDDLSIPNQGYRGNRAGRYGTGQGRVRPSMDPDTRRLVLFAGGLGAVLVVLIGASALMGRRGTEVPVVAADSRPIRVKPENPGGMKIDGAENDVFSGGTDTANSKLSAAAENPDTKALRTAETSPPAVVETPAPAAVTPPVTKPAVVASAPPGTKPPVAAVSPAAKRSPAKPPAAAAEAHPPASGHLATVQLAALSSEEAARNQWQILSKRMPDLLNGRQPIYSKTERDGHIFWRVRTAGFADVAQARAFCEHVRTKGGGCSVADF